MDLLSWNLRNGAVFEGDNIEAVLCPGAGQNSMIKESKNKRRIYYEEKNYKHAACSGNDHYYADRMWQSGERNRKTDTGAIVLDMYHSWSTDSERGAALDKLIQEFNKEYEGKIEVKVTINPDFPAYQEKVKTMISTDTTPDIFHYNFNPNDLSRQKSGKLMDFSEYMDDEWRARFGEGDLENLTIDGEITSIPFEKAGAVFYYNKEVFEKAGITEFPKTWDELLEACKRLKTAV